MNEADAIDLVQAAIWIVVIGAGPAVAAAMIVGVIIALMQALTQVQEATLTFVPKIIVVFLTISFTATYIGGQVYLFTSGVYARIEHGF